MRVKLWCAVWEVARQWVSCWRLPRRRDHLQRQTWWSTRASQTRWRGCWSRATNQSNLKENSELCDVKLSRQYLQLRDDQSLQVKNAVNRVKSKLSMASALIWKEEVVTEGNFGNLTSQDNLHATGPDTGGENSAGWQAWELTQA